MVKNSPANAGDIRDAALIPGWGRSPEVGHGKQLQYSRLGNPTDRRTWQATVHWIDLAHTYAWPFLLLSNGSMLDTKAFCKVFMIL